MVTRARRWLDDEEDDLSAFDPKHLARGKRVYRDGYGPKVHLMLTDSSPYARARMFDASAHRPHQARLTDAAIRRRARCDDAYEAMCDRNESAWTWGKEHVLAPVAVGDARSDYIRRISTDWQRGAVRYDLDPYRSAGNTTMNGGRSVAGPPTGGGHPDEYQPNATTASQYRTPLPADEDDGEDFDYTATDPEGGDDDYARSVWTAQRAVRSGAPDNAARVEALRRRTSYEDGGRYEQRDAATAQAIKDEAYAQMCARLQDAWRNP
jgi:hypothetical protein